jgi:hypothetical protein
MWLVVYHARTHIYRVDMINAQNSGIPKWAGAGRGVVVRISQDHYIVTRCRCVDIILRALNVVCGVVDTH